MDIYPSFLYFIWNKSLVRPHLESVKNVVWAPTFVTDLNICAKETYTRYVQDIANLPYHDKLLYLWIFLLFPIAIYHRYRTDMNLYTRLSKVAL